MDAGKPGGADHQVVVVVLKARYGIGDGFTDQADFLRQIADIFATLFPVPPGNFHPVEPYVAGMWRVDSNQQPGQRRLAGSGRSDNRQCFTGSHIERHVA